MVDLVETPATWRKKQHSCYYSYVTLADAWLHVITTYLQLLMMPCTAEPLPSHIGHQSPVICLLPETATLINVKFQRKPTCPLHLQNRCSCCCYVYLFIFNIQLSFFWVSIQTESYRRDIFQRHPVKCIADSLLKIKTYHIEADCKGSWASCAYSLVGAYPSSMSYYIALYVRRLNRSSYSPIQLEAAFYFTTAQSLQILCKIS